VYGIFTSIKQVRSGQKYDFYYWFGLWWFGVLASNVFYGIHLIVPSIFSDLAETIFLRISVTALGVTAVFCVGCCDVLKRESVEPIKMGVVIALGAVGVTIFYFTGPSTQYTWLGLIFIYTQQSIPAIFFLMYSLELKT